MRQHFQTEHVLAYKERKPWGYFDLTNDSREGISQTSVSQYIPVQNECREEGFMEKKILFFPSIILIKDRNRFLDEGYSPGLD